MWFYLMVSVFGVARGYVHFFLSSCIEYLLWFFSGVRARPSDICTERIYTVV